MVEETPEATLHGAIGELTPLDQAVMSAWLTKLKKQQKKDEKNGLSQEEQQKNLEKNLKELQKEVSGTLAKEQINQQTEAIKTLLQQLLERSQSKRWSYNE